MVKKNGNNDFKDKKLTNIKSVSVNRNPSPDDEIVDKKYVDDSIGENTIFRFIQTIDNSLKASAWSVKNNPTKWDKIQTTDKTIIEFQNTGGYLLQ